MEMYPKNDLYEVYKNNFDDAISLHRPVDVTKKRTLEVMNLAINCCEHWGASLDVGGGTGHYTIPLLHKFKKSVVVEVQNLPDHEFLKNKYSNFEYYNDFIENIDFKEKFDFILLVDIFEHIVDVNSFIKQVSELQNKGGVVYILTPNPLFCGPAEQSDIYYTRHENGHQKHYLADEIIKIMKGCDYEIIYTSYEESLLRQFPREKIQSISRNDKVLSERFYIYRKVISPVVNFVCSLLSPFVESYTYKSEIKHKDNKENTRAVAYIFKKIV